MLSSSSAEERAGYQRQSAPQADLSSVVLGWSDVDPDGGEPESGTDEVPTLAAAAILAIITAEPGRVCADPLKASVCEVLAHPERYVGKSVEIAATLDLGRHASLLTDHRCSKGIGIDARDIENAPEWRRIEAERWTVRDALVRMEIMGIKTTAIGVFEQVPDHMLLYVLRLQELRDVTIPPR